MTHRIQRISSMLIAVSFLVCPSGITSSATLQAPSTSAPCASAEHRQFDFWIGDWDVFDTGGIVPVSRVRVVPSLDHCVLSEHYEDSKGLRGDSFSIYDRSRAVWHQTWVTNQGQLLTIEGQLREGDIVLSGSSRSVTGEETLVRGTWKKTGRDVREIAVTSTDRGATWKTWFDLSFRPHDAMSQATDDEKTVAALDIAYQAAVKRNDADTMDRILADDFVLVTGSGKTYRKTDLLAAARARETVYEHQEDTEQTVRLWGDTAVVTAKLWEKGVTGGKAFDYTLWFSDTYVRTPRGWRYAFGQASLPLASAAPR